MRKSEDLGWGKTLCCSRRTFLLAAGSAALSQAFIGRVAAGMSEKVGNEKSIRQAGPGSKYVPRMKAAFVRRKGEYGMRWPGAIYDGEAAFETYRRQIEAAAEEFAMKVDIRSDPLYSLAEGARWLAQVEANRPDGLLLVLLDRQEHAWPTATRAVDSPVPAVIFAPIGAAFTTNTAPLAKKSGAFICSTDDFNQVVYGMKMIKAGAKLRETRFIVLRGSERKDDKVSHVGTKLRYVPARTFLELYNQTQTSGEIETIAHEYVDRAQRIAGPTVDDVCNGVRSYVVARTILQREEGDGITMDCLGAVGPTNISLPCIAWSRMLDHGVPAACEADIGACITHALVQYLFDRPGFQQDPVPDTANDCLIGAHCTCPTRLSGFDQPPEPFYLSHHHGMRDAVPVPEWRVGQRVTVADVLPSDNPDVPAQMIISAGEVVGNIAVPPSGGCVVSVSVKLDGVSDLLDYPGFHQIFFYGDYKKELAAYCKLYGIRPQIV